MANRRPQNMDSRRMDFRNNDRGKNFRAGVSPWQGGIPSSGLPNLLPLAGGSTEATLALASNIINLLQPRQNPVPSLLDMPIRRDFGPNMGRYDRGFGPNRMGPPGNFRRTGTYNRPGDRFNTNRKQFRPNDGPRQQSKSSQRKDADSKAKPVKESEQEDNKKKEQDTEEQSETKDKEDTKNETPKTRYDDINEQLLKCHICNKSMWDGRSFENHLSGRAHAIMMQKTAESYALTADTMRQEFKIREMKRTRKTGQQTPRDFFCAMCNIYAADGAIHRTTMGHRKLKKYLHPTCTSCHKEMPTRIELDEHRLTPEHLKIIQDKQEVITKPKPEVMMISTLNMEQLYLREGNQRKRRRYDEDKNSQRKQQEEDSKDKEEQQNDEAMKEDATGEEEVKKEPKEEDNKAELDNEDTIVDYNEGDDLSKITPEMLPAYSTKRGVGHSFLAEFSCIQCKLCHKLLDSLETANVHLRTWKHHQLFLKLISEKGGLDQVHQEGAKRSSEQNSDEPDSKRTKISDEEQNNEEQNGSQEEDVPMQEESENLQDENAKGDEQDMEMPHDDELEDWDEPFDDSNVKDEAENQQEEIQPEPEEEPEPEPEPEPIEEEKPKEKTPPPAVRNSPRGGGTPRGRGRGRGRARGRY